MRNDNTLNCKRHMPHEILTRRSVFYIHMQCLLTPKILSILPLKQLFHSLSSVTNSQSMLRSRTKKYNKVSSALSHHLFKYLWEYIDKTECLNGSRQLLCIAIKYFTITAKSIPAFIHSNITVLLVTKYSYSQQWNSKHTNTYEFP